jgi:predicted PurR-regulated permease PerM
MNNCYINIIPNIGIITFLIFVLIYYAIHFNILPAFISSIIIISISFFILVYGKEVINIIKDCKEQYKKDKIDKIDIIKSINNIVVPQEIVEEDIEIYRNICSFTN